MGRRQYHEEIGSSEFLCRVVNPRGCPDSFSGPAQAYVYDNFSTPGIDLSLWTETGPNNGLFSQPGDGYLNFSDPNPGNLKDSLRSFNSVSGAFFVSMQYLNFQSTNNQPPGQSKSSGVHLNLSDGTNIVNAQECKNSVGNFFQGYSLIGGVQTWYTPTLSAVNSGWLGIGYNGILGTGGLVTLWYNAGTGWTAAMARALRISAKIHVSRSWEITYLPRIAKLPGGSSSGYSLAPQRPAAGNRPPEPGVVGRKKVEERLIPLIIF